MTVALALGCARPGSERSRDGGATQAATALPHASALSAKETPEPETGDATGATADEPLIGPRPLSEAADENAGPPLATLETVSAERLLAEVRRLGGKGTLVNAWASWCGPCKHELPTLQKLATQLEPSGVHVLLVSLDEPDDRDKAVSFLREKNLTLTSYLAERPLGAFKRGMNPRWPGMLPASFLYDASGALRYFWGGEAFEEELTPVLDAFARGRPIQGEATPAIGRDGEK